MPSTDLPWLFLRRKVKPFALAVSFATAVITWAILADVAIGELLTGAPGHVVAGIGVAGVAALWYGWWGKSYRFLVDGLLLTSGVWVSVSTILLVEYGWTVNSALALAWVIASVGSYLLESQDGEGSV